MAALSPLPPGRHLERGLTLDRRKSIIFAGKLFYLDLPHNKQTQLLITSICSLGGVIESFLSKDVNYVVTRNKKAADVAHGASSSRKGGRSQPPTTEKIERIPYSRGKQLLKKVVQTQECSSILTSACSWGVCILHVDEVLEYLECSTQRRANRSTAGKGPGGIGQTLKVGKLKTPFLKIEDQSRKYRPIHFSFSKFPECSFISSDRSPFETAHTNNSTHKDRDPGEQEKDEEERTLNWEKSGYCECCQTAYAKLSEHLISEQHCLFALNASNYKVIDDITSQIVYDLVSLPHGFKPIEEQCEDNPPPSSLEEPPLEEYLGFEENRLSESQEQPVDFIVELPTVEHALVSPEIKEAACPMDNHSLGNLVIDPAQEHAGRSPENILVEDNGHQCTVSTTNALLPLADTCVAGEAAHMGLVTEVSWYTEEAGLTSVYTVQSLVIPPVHVLEQHEDLAVENAPIQSPLVLIVDPFHALAENGFRGSSSEPVPGDPITPAHIEPQMIYSAPHQTNNLLADERQVMPSAGLYVKHPAAPAIGSECTLHLDTAGQCPVMDVSGAEVPSVVSAVDQHRLLVSKENVRLLNSPCALQTEPSNHLSIERSPLSPCQPAAEDNVTVTPSTAPLGNLVDTQDPEPLVLDTDWCGGKRKHCWSPCDPPAKRQPLHCQPLPMWVFHQLPSSMNQTTSPVFSEWLDRDHVNRAAEDECSPPTLCFNPKLVQYEASSESDWDSQLLSPHNNNPQQTAHLGELRTAQISLDESLYEKRLRSVLAHEQTLGSPSTTQTVSLSHASYDTYLSGVAS
ncbi:protein DBF4 homolog B [Rhinoderma darwinii]|uniref:protein DBF4 homolog B n=1 Tax=Rhinoderma darwinii TaxID=43563 RepID=UPI003F66BE6E